MASHINYARAFGMDSVAAAAVFAAIYGVILPYYIWRAIRNPTYVLIMLSLFCAIRVTAFVMRAVLAGSDSAGEDLNLVIGELIVYAVGFFGLLYSAYTLVLDREIISGVVTRNPLSRITSNRHLIRIALAVAVGLGITGSTYLSGSTPHDIDLYNTLRKASMIIFLVVTALLAIHTLFLILAEHAALRNGSLHKTSPGSAHGTYTLCLIVILLLIREIYLTATLSTSRQNEALWYPFAALPELLAVLLFAVPGLVPEKSELAARAHGHGKNPEAAEMV